MNSQMSFKEYLMECWRYDSNNDSNKHICPQLVDKYVFFWVLTSGQSGTEDWQVAGNTRSGRICYLYLSKTILGASKITDELRKAALYYTRPAHFLSIQRHRMLSFILMWRVSIIRGPIKARGSEGVGEGALSICQVLRVGTGVAIRGRCLSRYGSGALWQTLV